MIINKLTIKSLQNHNNAGCWNYFKMKYIFIFFLSLPIQSFSQNEETLKIDFRIMSKHYIEGDFIGYSNYIHPKLIDITGGKREFERKTKLLWSKLNDAGMKEFLDFKLIYIKTIISKDSTLQALIGTEIIMNDLGKPRSFYFELICISDKAKTNWVFINAQNGEKVIRSIFPELSLNLPIT